MDDGKSNHGNDNRKSPSTAADAASESSRIVDGVGIVELYASLRQGQSVKQWYMKHSSQLANIDIRRFITFGIIKGFLYRVHKYAYKTGQPARVLESRTTTYASAAMKPDISSRNGNITPYTSSSMGEDNNHNSSSNSNPHSPTPSTSQNGGDISEQWASYRSGYGSSAQGYWYDEDDDEFVDDKTLSKYLDGMHCFDQICTELEMSERELMTRLKKYPWEVMILHR